MTVYKIVNDAVIVLQDYNFQLKRSFKGYSRIMNFLSKSFKNTEIPQLKCNKQFKNKIKCLQQLIRLIQAYLQKNTI